MALSSRCPVLLLIRCILLPFIHGALASIGGNISQIFRVYNATFSPPSLLQLKEGSTENVNLVLSFVYDDLISGGGALANFTGNGTWMSKNLSLCYRPEDPAVAWVPKDSGGRQCISSSLETGEILINNVSTGAKKPIYLMNTNFSVKGLFLGKTDVIVEVFCDDDDVDAKFQLAEPPVKNANKWSIFKQKFHCAVVRKDLRLQHIFVGTLSLLLIIANVLMGAQLNLDIVLNVIKTPLAPAIGFACQYLFMPLMSYALAWILFVPVGMNALALGMFTTGCSPGGGASNGYSVLLDANVDLSITMTFLSTVAALIMMPFWMFVLGRTFLTNAANKHINIPFNNIFYSLIALVVPLIIGAVLRKYHQKFAERANRILRPFLLVIIVFICTFGVYANFYMFRLMTWRVLLGGMLLPLMGFIFGAVSSLLMKQPFSNIKAIAIETGIQNTGIGIVLLQLSFGQPEADLAAVVPVVVAMFTPPPLLLALAVHYVQKCRSKKHFSDKQILNDEKDRRKIAERVSSIGGGGKKSKSVETNDDYSEDEDFKTCELRLVDSMKPLCQNSEQSSTILEEDNRAAIIDEIAVVTRA